MTKPLPAVAAPLQGKLIVSCQASEGDAFRDPAMMARFAMAALEGDAAAIRANGPADVRAIRAAVPLPIIGIQKSVHEDGRILITPTFEAARALVEAGADMIALDCTSRGQRSGALDRLRRIRAEWGVPVLADIATEAEAVAAEAAGADFVLSTMRGYTAETAQVRRFEPSFIAALRRAVAVPVIAEGRIATPQDAVAALDAGAFAVVVGGAITRPQEITRAFVRALARRGSPEVLAGGSCVGIDLGGTNTKAGVVDTRGNLTGQFAAPTPFTAGRDRLLQHLIEVAKRAMDFAVTAHIRLSAIGVATAGWVDPHTGRVAYATDNLPGWSGAPVAETLQRALGLPVAVENDANALAVAEKHFGAARDADHFVCITLGTGVGGGCYVNGRLNRGAHFFANALGHIVIEPDGLPCTCGQKGCLETYANASALLRYADAGFASAGEVIQAAHRGNVAARKAIAVYAGHLARGCAAIVHLLDPEMIVLAGGLAQDNPDLLSDTARELSGRIVAWPQRRLQLHASPLGYYGGVLGAAAWAMESVPAVANRSAE